ncbi:MAG: formyl transferase [SAR86 cluster bacterium]|uniref:Formyl transferase n=1 Tax=SAR86 cluster bacterium TaxID=2030880 RepID=A0A2A5AVV9_9GAMM|nr:MAG: formyl transferase [SAR86 cluster bacterium]
MKITILTNKDLASCVALNYLVPALLEHELTVFLSSRVGKSSKLSPGLKELKFYEQELFNDIVFPLIDNQASNDSELLTFNGVAALIGKPVNVLNAINTHEFDQFQQSQPDLVLSIRYGVILKEAAIAVPALGVINLHSGLLPNYKGVMATFRAMLNGDKEIGTTLHFIDDEGIDTGGIIGTTAMQLNSDKSYLWHVLELYRSGCELMLDSVRSIANSGRVECNKQGEEGNYYSFPSATELAEFNEIGAKLVDTDEILEIVKRFQTR